MKRALQVDGSQSEESHEPLHKKQRLSACSSQKSQENSQSNSKSNSNSVKSQSNSVNLVSRCAINSSKYSIWYPLVMDSDLDPKRHKHQYGARCNRDYTKFKNHWDSYEKSMKKKQHQEVLNEIWNLLKLCKDINTFKKYWDACESNWKPVKSSQSQVRSFFKVVRINNNNNNNSNKNKNENSEERDSDDEKASELDDDHDSDDEVVTQIEKEKEKETEKEKEKEISSTTSKSISIDNYKRSQHAGVQIILEQELISLNGKLTQRLAIREPDEDDLVKIQSLKAKIERKNKELRTKQLTAVRQQRFKQNKKDGHKPKANQIEHRHKDFEEKFKRIIDNGGQSHERRRSETVYVVQSPEAVNEELKKQGINICTNSIRNRLKKERNGAYRPYQEPYKNYQLLKVKNDETIRHPSIGYVYGVRSMIDDLHNIVGEELVEIGIDDKSKIPGDKDAAKMRGIYFVFLFCFFLFCSFLFCFLLFCLFIFGSFFLSLCKDYGCKDNAGLSFWFLVLFFVCRQVGWS